MIRESYLSAERLTMFVTLPDLSVSCREKIFSAISATQDMFVREMFMYSPQPDILMKTI